MEVDILTVKGQISRVRSLVGKQGAAAEEVQRVYFEVISALCDYVIGLEKRVAELEDQGDRGV